MKFNWGQVALLVLQNLPAILQRSEAVVPGQGLGAERKLTAISEMVKYEGALAMDQRVKDAKSRLIDAQVEYINATDVAARAAITLGIPINAEAAPPSSKAVPPGTATSTPPHLSQIDATNQPSN